MPLLFTIGHSTRTLELFVGLLLGYDVQRLVDVRTIPRSRHNPQFNRESLPPNLKAAGIEYVHRPALGGLRHARKDSPNGGWKNASFRGYADYMRSVDFRRAIDELISQARQSVIAVMCAEAVPWRCHRSLIADALAVRGVGVRHIMSRASAPDHQVTPWAKVDGANLLYPPAQSELPPHE
ncbi:MAG TPA: DUF488 domain-containing protein [Elusimicrobiota bacterium]|nr:DUF488 domain-containing protein [Elusimicrobiota bacterium]